MINFEKLVGRVGSDIDTPSANDSEDDSGVEVLEEESDRGIDFNLNDIKARWSFCPIEDVAFSSLRC